MTSQLKWKEFFKQAGISARDSTTYAKIFAKKSITFELLDEINLDVLNELDIRNSSDQNKILRQSKIKIKEECPEVIEHCEVTLESHGENNERFPVNALINGQNILDSGLTDLSEYLIDHFPATRQSSRRNTSNRYTEQESDDSFASDKQNLKVKRKCLWSEDDMDQALSSIRVASISLSEAARKFNIPRQTLHDRLHSKYNTNKYGRPTCLSETEEEILLDFIAYKNSLLQPLNITEIRMLATAIAKGNGRPYRFKNKGAGHAWWQCFRKRHEGRLKSGKPDRFQKGKSVRTNLSDLKKDFDEYALNVNHKYSTIHQNIPSTTSCLDRNMKEKKRTKINQSSRIRNKTTCSNKAKKSSTEPELLKTLESAQTQVRNWLNEIKDKSSEYALKSESQQTDNKKLVERADSFSESESEVSDNSDTSDFETSSSSGEETEVTDEEKTDSCAICHREKPAGTKKKCILWIFCEQCEYWYHVDCEGVTKKELQKDKYICKRCQYNK